MSTNKLKERNLNLPIVTLVGRTNVGKSTLFNKLIEKDKAIISSISGTTRDKNSDICEWDGRQFIAVDTAGIESRKKQEMDEIDQNVKKQIDLAIKTSDLIYFIVNIQDGILPEDRIIVKKLQKSKKKFFLVLNKADNQKQRNLASEFYGLGISNLQIISAKNGSGTADLLNDTLEELSLKRNTKNLKSSENFSISIVGKPNVGKSSLLNALLGYEKNIVSAIAHTTREPQDTDIEYNDKIIKIIDTAGIRRKFNTAKELEMKSVKKGIQKIQNADLCLFVIDISQPIDYQDKKLVGQIIKKHSSVILIANKYDLIDTKNKNSSKELEQKIYRYFPSLHWAPIIFVSAKTGLKVHKIMDAVMEIMDERNKEIPDNELEKLIKLIIKKTKKGKNSTIPYIYGLKQKEKNPPKFELTVKKAENMPKGLIDKIKKQIRERYKFKGTQIFLNVRSILER